MQGKGGIEQKGFESPPKNTKQKSTLLGASLFGAPEGIRTPDLLVRSQTLYPAELQAHI